MTLILRLPRRTTTITITMALEAGSPAIDKADGGACPATDQRGVTRPQGGGCDVGAFEAE